MTGDTKGGTTMLTFRDETSLIVLKSKMTRHFKITQEQRANV